MILVADTTTALDADSSAVSGELPTTALLESSFSFIKEGSLQAVMAVSGSEAVVFSGSGTGSTDAFTLSDDEDEVSASVMS